MTTRNKQSAASYADTAEQQNLNTAAEVTTKSNDCRQNYFYISTAYIAATGVGEPNDLYNSDQADKPWAHICI